MSQTTHTAPGAARRRAYLRGFLVFLVLAVLTALEFAIARTTGGAIGLLLLFGVIKAALIIVYYMHIRSVWSEEAHG